MRKNLLLLTLICILCPTLMWAQNFKVSGVVVDANDGTPIPGVSIVEKGTTIGGVTDFDGKYSINVSSGNATLVYTFIGYTPVEIAMKGRKVIDVKLEQGVYALEEVVAIGYGSAKRKELTGAVSSVDMDELQKVPVSNVSEALQGRVAGLQITTADGQPGADIYFRVRGGNSITQDNTPLIIIDGFAGGDLSAVDPSDIASIDVLRDVASTAIYGASGANGVILVTTKSAKEGNVKVTYNGYVSHKKLTNSIDLMNPLEYAQLQYEIWGTGDDAAMFEERFGAWDELESIYGDREGVDWLEEVFGDGAYIQNHSVNVSGGTKAASYNLALSHADDDGIQLNSGYRRDIAKFKINSKVNDKLSINGDISYSKDKVIGAGSSDANAGGGFLKIIRYRPTIGKEGEDKDLLELSEDPFMVDDNMNAAEQNPVKSALSDEKVRYKKVVAINGGLNYKVLKGLTYIAKAGYNYNTLRTDQFYTEDYPTVLNYAKYPYGYISQSETERVQLNHTINFDKKIKKHKLGVMLGQEYIKWENKSVKANAKDFPNGDIGLANLGVSNTPVFNSSYEQENSVVSFFGRATYNYDERYLFNFTYRIDGSSKFGDNNKYGYFPAGSFAWRINQEDFFKDVTAISNMKLRLSYGVSGNDRIGNYLSLVTYGNKKYQLNNNEVTGFVSNGMANPNLKWETTTSRNLGFDLGLFKQRIQFSADLFQANTEDLLLNTQVPYTTGSKQVMMNIGETENKGLELVLNTVNIKKRNFEWRTSFNISFYKNKVVALASGQEWFDVKVNGGDVKDNNYLVKVGEPVGLMFGYESDGLYMPEDFDGVSEAGKWTLKEDVAYQQGGNKPGDVKLVDISGPDGEKDGKIDLYDRKILGNPNPKHFGGMTNTFTVKNFDLSVAMNWSYGNDIYNVNKLSMMGGGKYRNRAAFMVDRFKWINENGEDISTNPEELTRVNANAIYPGHNSTYQKAVTYDKLIEDGSFLRINNVTLGYQLPKSLMKKLNMTSMRVYGTVNNLHVFTDYSGVDPEVSTRGHGLTAGVDAGAYPKSRSVTFGVNVTF
ncbi:TonB-dependent receptor [Puteibacter caeruleilacunae]|nr:TonB-dependent receptor [Puteibacter caeruleilacunae]